MADFFSVWKLLELPSVNPLTVWGLQWRRRDIRSKIRRILGKNGLIDLVAVPTPESKLWGGTKLKKPGRLPVGARMEYRGSHEYPPGLS